MEKKISDLQLEVQKAILDDPRTKEHGIEVLDDNGVITLQGRVSSHGVVESAKLIVEDVRGVTSVINALEVHDRENELAL